MHTIRTLDDFLEDVAISAWKNDGRESTLTLDNVRESRETSGDKVYTFTWTYTENEQHDDRAAIDNNDRTDIKEILTDRMKYAKTVLEKHGLGYSADEKTMTIKAPKIGNFDADKAAAILNSCSTVVSAFDVCKSKHSGGTSDTISNINHVFKLGHKLKLTDRDILKRIATYFTEKSE